MKIRERLDAHLPTFSFEFFPPKTEEGLQKLYATIEHLAELSPAYVSVTYGAGGSTRDRTVELAAHIRHAIGLETVAHLTGNSHTREEMSDILCGLRNAGIENVLALRGDPPKKADWTPPADAFHFASDLVAFIRKDHDFCIAAACYPETHTDCADPEQDLAHLVHKVNQGVDFLVTQLFFDNSHYFSFVRRARAAGVTIPIVPGIMPVTNAAQVARFTKMCGATIPPSLWAKLEKVQDDEQAVMAVGIEWAIRQCRELLALGAPGIHFYTLNRSLATRVVCTSLQYAGFGRG